MQNRISREELVRIYNVEITFFDSLEEAGLVTTELEDEVKYLRYDDLGYFEKFANWHYDLEVNLPGLEIIHHLLQKMEALHRENRQLSKSAVNDSLE